MHYIGNLKYKDIIWPKKKYKDILVFFKFGKLKLQIINNKKNLKKKKVTEKDFILFLFLLFIFFVNSKKTSF